MNAPPVLVFAYAITTLWAFAVGALLIEEGSYLAQLSAAQIGAVVAGLLTPLVLLWLCVLLRVQRVIFEARFDELRHRLEQLAARIGGPDPHESGARDGGREAAEPPPPAPPVEPTSAPRQPSGSVPGPARPLVVPAAEPARSAQPSFDRALGNLIADAEQSIEVIEGEEVGPEFIHRSTGIVDGWIEVEFRNVGGPARNLIAITEGDTDTRVDEQSVGSWKSVRVSLQPLGSIDEAFRFCLVFNGPTGDERQQFFRYCVDDVVAIARPES